MQVSHQVIGDMFDNFNNLDMYFWINFVLNLKQEFFMTLKLTLTVRDLGAKWRQKNAELFLTKPWQRATEFPIRAE